MKNVWILYQHEYDEKHKKFFMSKSYDDIMKYIKSFDNVQEINFFHYVSNEIYFDIHLGEEI